MSLAKLGITLNLTFRHLNLFPERKRNSFQGILAILLGSPMATVYYLHKPAIDLELSLLDPVRT